MHCFATDISDSEEGSMFCSTHSFSLYAFFLICLLLKKQIYKGYVDDPRNTDNAWMETEAVNYHDETSNFTNVH